ncbi:MAG: molybdopterin synthase sulfur carrier subunit [Kiritimatiellia bacterium]|jgi:molybdopterin synthase sulfur carrier subunit
MLKILYFAQLRDTLNCSEENLGWQTHFNTIDDVKTVLSQRDEKWQKAFNKNILSALNQQMAQGHREIKEGDEIAFFPPVTGG